MRKNKIDHFAWQNMSEDEQKSYQETFKQYKSFRSELLKKNEAEVNIKVTDPQLIATLHHAMQGYC